MDRFRGSRERGGYESGDADDELAPGRRTITANLGRPIDAPPPEAPGRRALTDRLRASANNSHGEASPLPLAPGAGDRPEFPFREQLEELFPSRAPDRSRGATNPREKERSPEATARRGTSGPGTSLPFLGQIQASFGRHDVSNVQAHADDNAVGAASELGAHAFAYGNQVAFAGTPDVHTAAHEAAHTVQQRAGVALAGGSASDVYEQHADEVADTVVAGRSAENLLDRVAGQGATAAPIVQRKQEDRKPPTRTELRSMMERYLYDNQRHVWESVGNHIRAVQLPTPHPRLDWRDYGGFVVKLLKQLETYVSDFKPLTKLDDVLFPSDAEKTIGGILPATIGWFPEIGMAIAHAFHIAIVQSIKRLAPRYLEVADSKGVSGEDRVEYTELILSTPIDRYVAVALCWKRVVTIEPLDAKAARAAKGKHVGLRDVNLSYEGAKDRSLWNWVRAESPGDATAEDVAAKLWVVTDDHGDKASFNAYLLAAAPPLFGVPTRFALKNPNLSRYAPPNVDLREDSVDRELLQIASSARSDDAALRQQGKPGPKPSGGHAELGNVLEALRDCSEQLAFTHRELAKWNLAQHVTGAEAFLRRKEAEVSTLDQAKLADWAPVIAAQKDRLVRISGGIHAVIQAAGKLGISDPNSDQAAPLREILELFAVAAGTSHLAQTSEAKLLQALQQQNVLSLRALQATERNMMAGVGEVHRQAGSNDHTAAIGSGALKLQERSLRLQEKLANGDEVDPDELEDVSVKSEEVALESRLYGTLDAIVELNKAAREAGQGDAAIIASMFSGKFRDLPALTKHIADELNPIRNTWRYHRQLATDEELKTKPTVRRKKEIRAARRRDLNDAQQKFDKLAKDRDLQHFFQNATETIKNQQFRTACVKVAAMIGISLIAGAAAGLAARMVGGVLMEATGATAVSELGMTARAGIAITRIGVDTTISSAGTVAVQGGSFGDVWKENLITSLASSAVFGSISRYAAEQAELEGRIAVTWSKATKLGKLGMIGKEVGAITAHTLWGAAMGEVAGRIVTGQSQPPPETLRDWALQGISVAVGRHVSHVLTTKSKLYQQLEASAENAGRGMVAAASKLQGLAKRVISGKQPDLALELLNEHDKFLRKELEAIDGAYAKTGDPTGELSAARERIKAAAEAVGSHGMLDTKFTLIGMEELVPGALWKGTKEQIQQATKQAEADGQKPKVLGHDEGSKRWKLQIGDRTIEVQEVVSTAKTVNAERILLAGSDEDLRMAAKLVVPEPGTLDVVIHGTVDDFTVIHNGQEVTLSHRSLAKYIESTGIKFKRIRLLACKSGLHPKGAAQQLANKLGVPVEAPTDALYIHPDGTLTIGPHETRNTGRWEEFSPKPSESRYERAQVDVDHSEAKQGRHNGGPKRLGGGDDERDEVMDGLRGHSDRSYDNVDLHQQGGKDAPETRAIRPRDPRAAGAVANPGDVHINEHHIFPQEYQSFFRARGVDIHDFVVDLPVHEHQAQHGGGDFRLARSNNWDENWQEWNGEIITRLQQAEAAKRKRLNNPRVRLNRAEILALGRALMQERGMGDLAFHRYTQL